MKSMRWILAAAGILAAGALSAKLKAGKAHPPVAASDAEIKAMAQYVLPEISRLSRPGLA